MNKHSIKKVNNNNNNNYSDRYEYYLVIFQLHYNRREYNSTLLGYIPLNSITYTTQQLFTLLFSLNYSTAYFIFLNYYCYLYSVRNNNNITIVYYCA